MCHCDSHNSQHSHHSHHAHNSHHHHSHHHHSHGCDCDCLPHHPINQGVLELLGSDCILFTGSYNKNDRVLVSDITTITSTLSMNISVNPSGYNPRIVVSHQVSDNLLPPNDLLDETFTISSYENDLKTKLGLIEFTNFYPNTGTITTSKFLSYDVLTKSGLFKCVKYVIIDFTNDIRTLYFVGKNK